MFHSFLPKAHPLQFYMRFCRLSLGMLEAQSLIALVELRPALCLDLSGNAAAAQARCHRSSRISHPNQAKIISKLVNRRLEHVPSLSLHHALANPARMLSLSCRSSPLLVSDQGAVLWTQVSSLQALSLRACALTEDV